MRYEMRNIFALGRGYGRTTCRIPDVSDIANRVLAESMLGTYRL